jgi:hypothetical protein
MMNAMQYLRCVFSAWRSARKPFFRNFFKDFLSARRCARVWQTFA